MRQYFKNASNKLQYNFNIKYKVTTMMFNSDDDDDDDNVGDDKW